MTKKTSLNANVPFWVSLSLALACSFGTSAYVVVSMATGHQPPDPGLNAALAVVAMMAPGIVGQATKRRLEAKPSKDDPGCAALKVLGRHDGSPCASCELQGNSITRRGV